MSARPHVLTLLLTGVVIIAAPLKLVAGSGSPLRVIALVPSE